MILIATISSQIEVEREREREREAVCPYLGFHIVIEQYVGAFDISMDERRRT